MTYYRMKNTGQVVTENEYRLASPLMHPAVFRPTDADPIFETPAPAITEHQRAVRNGVKQDALLNWVWDWDIVNFTAPEIEAYEAAKLETNAAIVDANINKLWQAADAYVTNFISGLAIGVLTIGVIQNKPKALAVRAWSAEVWGEYYIRKAAITATSTLDTDFSTFGPIPYSVRELQSELGM